MEQKRPIHGFHMPSDGQTVNALLCVLLLGVSVKILIYPDHDYLDRCEARVTLTEKGTRSIGMFKQWFF